MKIYKITEASEYLGVSINTLKTLANNGKVKSFKTTGEHRRFRQEDLDAYMGVEKEKQEKLTVIYARCSTAKQKENLERQKDRLRKHAEAKGYKYVLIDEIASGINEKRNGIHKLIKMCFEGKVERILIEYKDRLARFGYEYLDAIFKNLEITVEVVETKEKKYEEELAEDIMKILTCYSARFYGRRGGRKKKNTAEDEYEKAMRTFDETKRFYVYVYGKNWYCAQHGRHLFATATSHKQTQAKPPGMFPSFHDAIMSSLEAGVAFKTGHVMFASSHDNKEMASFMLIIPKKGE